MTKFKPLPKKVQLIRNDVPLPDILPITIETRGELKPDIAPEELVALEREARNNAAEGWLRREAESNPDGEYSRTYFTRK